jgi:GntR family transcriptional regulator, carbon starvation induced regulator
MLLLDKTSERIDSWRDLTAGSKDDVHVARTLGSRTRHEALFLRIRRNLLRGEFPRGHRFKVNALSVAEGVSVGVVREALTRLAEQGLVVAEPNKGYSVPDYTRAEIQDLAFVRAEIEGLAVRLAIEQGDVDWETDVVAAHHRLSITPSASLVEDPAANDRWSEAHRAFHAACASGCRSPRLLAIRAQLYDSAEIVRQMAKLSPTASHRDVAGEHRAIFEAVIARDASSAGRLLAEHIGRTCESCVAALDDEQPTGET